MSFSIVEGMSEKEKKEVVNAVVANMIPVKSYFPTQMSEAEHEAFKQAERESMQRQILKAKDRLEVLDRLVSKLYDDLLNGKISEKNFDSMMERTAKEQKELAAKIEEYESNLSNEDRYNSSYDKWVELVGNYIDIKELDADMLNQLVKKIVVHEDITDDGTRNISVEIHYNFKPVNEPHKHYLNDNAEGVSSPLAV